MNPTVVIGAIFLFGVSLSSAYEIVQGEDGQKFYLVPVHSRERRELSLWDWELDPTNRGGRGSIGHRGTIYNQNGNRLDAGAFASKHFHPNGPITVGGNLDYSHTPSGSNFNIEAQRTPGFGTDVSASGVGNIWRKGDSRLDAVGSYNRHFGGPGGTGRPDAYGGLEFSTKI